ncbi:hypothetical protein C0Q70_20917 [Pomacea canaliculata]|uniref:LRRNT domain-containing protein n=1 Tax=Pomacea canaliculata TaxID=400727 RepID=A0A2T7NB25_POMCA|nr:hypothetical protein C0Q70_20917 [Pomacea canaliculata]
MNDWDTSDYLQDIQYCGNNLENVVEMALNNDSLVSFPDQLKTIFPNLTSLEVNNNSLTSPIEFPWKRGFFRLPRNLSRPALHDDKYTYSGSLLVPPNTFRREFLLDWNRITNLTHFRFSSDFQYISLQWNRMRTIAEDTFRDVTSLQFLSLAHNELTSLPANLFASLTNLTRLDLQNNLLQSLPAGIFGNLRNLKQLNLESNRLAVLESGLFANLVRLEVLLLGKNNISVVSDGAFSTAYPSSSTPWICKAIP